MKRAVITIDEYGKVKFPNTPKEEIWMSGGEMLELFGIVMPTLKATIKEIYRSGVLNQYESERCITLPSGNSMDVYSFAMIMAISFRLNTPFAGLFREYIIHKLTDTHHVNLLFYSVRTHAHTHICN